MGPVRFRPVCLLLAIGVLGVVGCSGGGAGAATDDPLLVAAASDLRPAFAELGAAFEAEAGERVVFNFGSSGQLAQQIIEGAPMDLFASASVAYVERVLEAGVGDAATQATYAHGRLAMWSPAARWREWDDLEELAADDRIRTVAIANPEHAPYGLAARQALESAGVLDRIGPKLVHGENVSDAQRLAATGNADVAIVALSLALAADEAGEGDWQAVDAGLHEPLQQDLLIVASDPDRARRAARFAAFVNGEQGRAVMRRFGLSLPGETTPDEGGSGAEGPDAMGDH
ncbi:molybdate ABC transporter substrate-binding protein [Egicoccus sp. AB-alg6-2]|uniref:molybdate ABC transporter substrate-binding protein n=1 Tax=Egicoccus sp. AB-alg6-2 TaxID=3242692 RepID=UPI00359EAE6F